MYLVISVIYRILRAMKHRQWRRLYLQHQTAQIIIITQPHTQLIAENLADALTAMGFHTQINAQYQPQHRDILHWIICPQSYKRLPRYFIAYQLEQKNAAHWFKFKRLLRLYRALSIVDYSPDNIAYLQQKYHFKRMLLLQTTPSLKRFNAFKQQPPSSNNIVFYGDSSSPRRQQLLAQITQKYPVDMIQGVFGAELWQRIAQAKIVLNLHFYDQAVLETTRIHEVISLNRIVISETHAGHHHQEQIFQHILSFPSHDFECLFKQIECVLANEAQVKQGLALEHYVLQQHAQFSQQLAHIVQTLKLR